MMIQEVLAQAKCVVNGQEVPCEDIGRMVGGLLKLGLTVFAIIAIVALIALIFWIKMLVHAIKNPIEQKPVWIIVMLLFGIVGAIIYYLAVKRPFVSRAKEKAAHEAAERKGSIAIIALVLVLVLGGGALAFWNYRSTVENPPPFEEPREDAAQNIPHETLAQSARSVFDKLREAVQKNDVAMYRQYVVLADQDLFEDPHTVTLPADMIFIREAIEGESRVITFTRIKPDGTRSESGAVFTNEDGAWKLNVSKTIERLPEIKVLEGGVE